MHRTLLALVLTVLVCGCVGQPPVSEKEQGEETCFTSNGTSMSLSDAKEIAKNSECGDRFKKTTSCNAFTGTWWIDLDLQKQGCNPACVVDICNKSAEINWRCTGLLP